MQPIILIAWNTLTTGWDSYVDTFTTTKTMTYLDLLTTLQSFSDDELQQNAVIFDDDVRDFLPVRNISRIKDDPEREIYGEMTGDVNYYLHI